MLTDDIKVSVGRYVPSVSVHIHILRCGDIQTYTGLAIELCVQSCSSKILQFPVLFTSENFGILFKETVWFSDVNLHGIHELQIRKYDSALSDRNGKQESECYIVVRYDHGNTYFYQSKQTKFSSLTLNSCISCGSEISRKL